jgi:hypothetical protein
VPFIDQSEMVRAAVEDLLERYLDVHAMRQKDGRTVAVESRSLLEKVYERIGEVLRDTKIGPSEEDIRAEMLRMLKRQQVLRGI